MRQGSKIEFLNPNQEKFCRLYASDKEFFGNGVESYLEAYDLPHSKYKAAGVSAARLLENAKILARINELLSITLNDQVVDKELAFTVIQKRDLSSKVQAIKEYNRVKKRVDDSPKVLQIGQIIAKLENDRSQSVIEQGVETAASLLDSGQTKQKSSIPRKQSTERLPAKSTQ